MTNAQPPRRPTDDPEQIEVHHAWWTIQGEGPHVGRSAVFVRLFGCNLQCPGCDTDYTSQRRVLSPREVVEVVRGIRPSGLVVLTGGEPLRQDISKLVELLLAVPYEVQIETNGILYRELPWDEVGFSVVCSPKTPNVSHLLAPHVDAWKYVLDHRYIDPTDGLPTSTLAGTWPVARPEQSYGAETYVQPLDTGDPVLNQKNLEACIESVVVHGYRLSVQVHKLVGLE